MERSLQVRRTLQSDLREAIENESITLAFQPQFSSATLEVVGFEALARWKHPTLGPIAPDLFIRIAEEAGMIETLGDQMLLRACNFAVSWPQPLRIAVNLSPLQFRGDHLPNQVEAVLWQTGLSPARLELEVTEGVLIREEKQAHAILSALNALGVGLALDDFGTGYASLSYLRRFQFDTLKIDKSFVLTLVEDEGTRAIFDAILAMAHRLKLRIVAEGVETEAQMAILRNEGCTELQGYLLGRPMMPEAVPELIRTRGARLTTEPDPQRDSQASYSPTCPAAFPSPINANAAQ
jgi:EAL domain-containing protein (putative c-di-GMP-specific phosphodiesterase class I)